MIRHIVFFRCKSPDSRETVFDGLSLLKGIPHCQNFEIGRNMRADTISGQESPDFVVYCEFENEAALEAYKAHPLYQQSIAIVRPLRDMRIAADFASDVREIGLVSDEPVRFSSETLRRTVG